MRNSQNQNCKVGSYHEGHRTNQNNGLSMVENNLDLYLLSLFLVSFTMRQGINMPRTEFEQNLEKYAEVIVKVGLNLQPGQRLLIRAVPFDAAPLIRLIVMKAYQSGARYVDVLWDDAQLNLLRFQHAPRDSFDEFPTWKSELALDYFQHGDADLSVFTQDPDLLNGQDAELVAKVQLVGSRHAAPVIELLAKNVTNWLVVSVPIPAWSAKVLPDVALEQREARMWDTIFEMCRVKLDNPVAAWQEHSRGLAVRCDYLTHKCYTALKYNAPGTNLTVGLPAGHIWHGGSVTSENGIPFIANIPTEEVFTLPHKDKVDGVVTATRPYLTGGALIQNFSLTFEAGRVVKAVAEKGEVILQHLLATDEGARRLGEVALVPHKSPISQSGLLFYNPLYDENAANHLAVGNAYRFSLESGVAMSDDDFAAAGGNNSLIHEDFMIGSSQMAVDGITAGGTVEPVMRNGNWAFDV